MERRRSLGVFAIAFGVLLFIGMAAGLGRAVQEGDVSAFFLVPFLLTAALVCLGVGFHALWGHRAAPPEETPSRSPASHNGGSPPT